MDKITFSNKVDTKVTTVAEINKVTGANLNEIKNVTNLAVDQLTLNTTQIANNKEDITSLINGNGKTYISVSNAMAASPLPSDNSPFTVRDSVSNLEDGYYIYLSTEVGGYKFLEALEAISNGYYVVNSLLDFDSLISNASTGVWMVISDITLDANKTIPAGVTLQFRNAKINLGGFTLTGTDTKIDAGLTQIFDKNASVEGLNVEATYPQWFGAVGNGIADDTESIKSAYSASINVIFPSGEYRTTSTITFDESYTQLDFNENARIFPDGTHTGVVIGRPSPIPTRMKINRLKVDRRSYQASTIGVLFLEVNQSTFDDMESRFSAWNFTFRPTTAGCAYNTFNNVQAIGGQYNFWLNTDSGTGFTNENTFVGGRGFCTTDTVTNFRISGTGENGHNKLIGMSLEGQGSSGIYDDGGSNAFYNCRSEGVWTTAFHQVGANALYYTIVSGRYDYTMEAPLKDTQRGTVLVYQDGSILSSAVDGKTTLTLSNDANSNGTGLAINMQNDNTDVAFKVHVTDSGVDRTVLTNSGLLTLATGIDCSLGGWNRIPIELRGTRIWTDSSNRVLQKAGSDPSGETDGNSIGLGNIQTTVGVAGGASALPATPSGYTNVRVGNNDFLIPYYAKP